MTRQGKAPERRDDHRLLSQADSEALLARVAGFARGGGQTVPEITSWWQGELRWGRNRATLASDRREVWVAVQRALQGTWGEATTNQVDAVSLKAAVHAAERNAVEQGEIQPWLFYNPPPPLQTQPRPAIWSEATYNLTTEARGELARALVQEAEAQGLLSAGYLEVRAGSRLRLVNGERYYVPYTQAQCSMTVRDPQGTGSGWAGLSSYDWAKIDPPALAKRALQKCLASRNPVALEPGRYTVVLEPQAVADLLEVLVRAFDRKEAELGDGPFALGQGRSKLGLKVVDTRLTLSHDPLDPNLGILPEPGLGPLTWIEQGVLSNLAYDRGYALEALGEELPLRAPEVSYRLSGGETSVEEMIATTKRGLLVTRCWGITGIDGQSLLSTGLTRDGLWLIENGKIIKPVKNFRFTESPLFMLNQVEQLGVPVPVFRPVRDPDSPYRYGGWTGPWPDWPLLTPAVVPPLKVRDFSFTSLADAI